MTARGANHVQMVTDDQGQTVCSKQQACCGANHVQMVTDDQEPYLGLAALNGGGANHVQMVTDDQVVFELYHNLLVLRRKPCANGN